MALPDASKLWSGCLAALSTRLMPRTIETLLAPMRALDATADTLGAVLLLEAPNEFAREWVARNYTAVIEEELARHVGMRVALHWTVAPERESGAPRVTPTPAPVRKTAAPPARKTVAARSANTSSAAPSHTSHTLRETPSPPAPLTANANANANTAAGALSAPPGRIAPVTGVTRGLRPRYTFEHFVVGPSNQLAHAAARTMDEHPLRFNPLFLCGQTGLGKTHLVNAVGHQVMARNADAAVVYVSAEHFTNEYVHAIQTRTMDAFRARYRRDCAALLLDDVQFFAGKESTLEEFFHTFNALFERECPIVLTSDVMPQDLKGMPERLVSRFASGLVAEMYPPELETRIAIVNTKAALEGIELAPEAAAALAQGVTSNVRELEGTLMRLAVKASLAGHARVELASVQSALHLVPRALVSTVEDVQKAVCAHYRIRMQQLVGRERHAEVAYARQVAMYLCRERLGTSYPQIGERFGGKDHTTAIAAVKKIARLVTEKHDVVRDLDAIGLRLGGR